MANEVRDPRTHAIIGAAMEVHRELGNGFLEAVYQQALAAEFDARGVPFRKEVEFPVVYKGRALDAKYRADFVCYDAIVVEAKALPKLATAEQAQVINYLKASGLEVGLLLNFGSRSLDFRRLILSNPQIAQRTPISGEAAGTGQGAERDS